MYIAMNIDHFNMNTNRNWIPLSTFIFLHVKKPIRTIHKLNRLLKTTQL